MGKPKTMRVGVLKILTMKKINSVLLVCLLLAFGAQSYAQKFGVQAGLNLSTILDKDDDDTYSDDYKMLPGFNAGVTFEMGFGDLIAVEAALLAETKGYKEEYDFMGYSVTEKISVLYLDIPVLVKVGPSFGPAKVFGAVGPYVGVALAGKYKGEGGGDSESEDLNIGSGDDDDIKRLDFGAKFGIGAEISKFCFGAYYSLGLANISPYTDYGTTVKNRAISISVGFKF